MSQPPLLPDVDSAPADTRHVPVTAAERGLLEAVDADGRFDARELEPAERVVRPAFLRALLLSRIGSKAVPETGLKTLGLVFEDRLDLAYVSRNGEPLPPLYLRQARLQKGASFDDACLSGLDLEGAVSESHVWFNRAQVLGIVWLDRLDCQGGVYLVGATIGGQLSLSGAKLKGSANDQRGVVALSAYGATIKGGVFFPPAYGHRFEAVGEVSIASATIGVALSLNGAKLKGSADAQGRVGPALSADGATINGDVFCQPADGHRFEAEGEIRLPGATIGGDLSFEGASLKGAVNAQGRVIGNALSADHATIKGRVFCRPADGHRFEAEGEVRLLGTEIGGQLVLKGASFKGTADDEGRIIGDALSARRVKVVDAVFFDEDFMCRGAATFSGAMLNDLYLGGSFSGARPGLDALNLSDVSLRRLNIHKLSGFGKVNLEGAKADTFDGFFLERWGAAPTGQDGLELDLDGFTYRRAEFGTDRPKKRTRRWAKFGSWNTDAIAENVLDLLDREFRQAAPGHDHYMPQPFEQAARTLREAGYDRAANAVAVAKREFKRACRADGTFAAFLSGLSALFFRHGYGPLRATAWVIAFVVMGAWVFSAIDEGGGLVIADVTQVSGAIVDSALPDGACRVRGGPPDLTGCAKATNELLAAGLNLAEQPINWALNATLGVPRPRPARAAGTPTPRVCPEHPIAYSLDTLLPLVDFGVDKRCRVADDYPRRGLAETFRIAFAIFGWLFIPMVALTFTGVLRKD